MSEGKVFNCLMTLIPNIKQCEWTLHVFYGAHMGTIMPNNESRNRTDFYFIVFSNSRGINTQLLGQLLWPYIYTVLDFLLVSKTGFNYNLPEQSPLPSQHSKTKLKLYQFDLMKIWLMALNVLLCHYSPSVLRLGSSALETDIKRSQMLQPGIDFCCCWNLPDTCRE